MQKNSSHFSFNSSQTLNRVKEYLGVKSDNELSKLLNISNTAIANWKKRNSLDFVAILTLCEGADLNWLFFGVSNQSAPPEVQKLQNEVMELQKKLINCQEKLIDKY